MRYMSCLVILCLIAVCVPAAAVEVRPLAACTNSVFKSLHKSKSWTGKRPDDCNAAVYVEQRESGIFVTAWSGSRSDQGWVRVSFSAAMGLSEIGSAKLMKKAGRDILSRAAHIERCLNSIIKVNDPLDCRDSASKSYRVGEMTGTDHERLVWLEDNGRHTVVEYSYGDSHETISPPADLFSGPALPPGTTLNLLIFDRQ